MVYLLDDVWGIVKEFMLDWKRGWHRKMKLILDDVRCNYPRILVEERYSMKTSLYYTTFSVPNYQHSLELRVCNQYDIKENEWINGFIPGHHFPVVID